MLAVISNVKRAGISPMPVPSPPSQFRVIRKLDLANKLFWSREPLPKRSYHREAWSSPSPVQNGSGFRKV